MFKLESLKQAKSLSDLAGLLGYRPEALSFIVYKIPEESKYYSFKIPKRNGESREIMAPTEKLKKLQIRLSQLLTDCYDEIDVLQGHRKSLSHGFRKKHSIITNASNHKNKRYIFNIDLQDFFPSVNFGRVRGFFISNNHFKLNAKVATVIAQIACHNNQLPQGSPCSPIISNLIGHILDMKMVNLAKKAKCTYSRYADDLTFSTNKRDFPGIIAVRTSDNIWKPSEHLEKEVEKVQFKINRGKTSMQYKTSRQITTGLVVNEKVNIKREYYKNIRSCCYSLFNTGEFYFHKHENPLSEGSESNSNESTIYKISKGSLKQLEGCLCFIYHIKRTQEKNKKDNNRRFKPNAITKLFRCFLLYKNLYNIDMPLIICEGKTDITYLKCALKNLNNHYDSLIKKNENKYSYQVRFLNFSKNFKDVFDISEGTSGIKFLIEDYKTYTKKFKSIGKRSPVIIILDTDKGSSPILNSLKGHSCSEPFINIIENLYIIFISDSKDKEIEDLFDKEVLERKIDGKSFNPNKPHADHTEYGKYIFAERVIKVNQKEINFDNFKTIFNRLMLVLDDYSKKFQS